MAEPLTIRSERADDIPLLVAQLDRMGLQPLLHEHFPTHGNWVGLSLGWVTVRWLTHILVRGGASPESRATVGRPAPSHAAQPYRATGGSPGPQ